MASWSGESYRLTALNGRTVISSASLSLEIKASAIPSSNASSRSSATKDLKGKTAIVFVVALSEDRCQKYIPITLATIKATVATSSNLVLSVRVSGSGVRFVDFGSVTLKLDDSAASLGNRRDPPTVTPSVLGFLPVLSSAISRTSGTNRNP